MKSSLNDNLSRTPVQVLADNPLVLCMIEEVTAGFMLLDRDWRFAWISAQARQRLRHKSGELLGRTIWIEYPEIIGTELERKIREGRQNPLTYEIAGRPALLTECRQMRFLPLADGVAVVIQDAPGRNAVERDPGPVGEMATTAPVIDQDHLIESIADASPNLIWLYDRREERFQYCNRQVFETLGYPPAEIGSRSPQELVNLIHPDDLDGCLKASGRLFAARSGERVDVEVRIRHQRGHWCWIALSALVFERDHRGHPLSILGTGQDITGKKRLATQVLRAQRLESLGTLAEGIAHDLNNVLAPVLMSIQLLKMKHLDPDSKRWLGTMHENIERGAGMIRQILHFTRGSQSERRPLRPGPLVRRIGRTLEDLLPGTINVVTEVPPNTWSISGDPNQLQEALINLALNARDAMPSGGTLKIGVENQELDEAAVRENIGAQSGRYVVISVTDDGEGIPPEYQARVFEPFFTTREQGKGNGLGLASVQGIIRGHDGFIDLWSEPGAGTVFQVFLPALMTADKEVNPVARQSTRPESSVLVVDDEEPALDLCRRSLEKDGYQVLTARDGVEAIAIYAARREEIGAVITDLAMPMMDGPATIRALFKLNPGVKIIALRGTADEEKVAEASSAGAQIFLPKPIDAERLGEILGRRKAEGGRLKA